MVELLLLLPCTFLSMSHASKAAVLPSQASVLFAGQRQPAERVARVLFAQGRGLCFWRSQGSP